MAADEAVAPVEPVPEAAADHEKVAKIPDEERPPPEKVEVLDAASDGSYDVRKEDHFGEAAVLADAKDLLTHVLHVDDDPSLSPWTFRALLIGW